MAFTRPQRKSLDKDQPLASSTGFEPSLMLRDVTMQSAARVFRPWRPAPPEEARQSLLDASPGQQSDDVPLIEAIERPVRIAPPHGRHNRRWLCRPWVDGRTRQRQSS